MKDWKEIRAAGIAERTHLETLTLRYVEALAGIVAVLGPDRICTCDFPKDCGLPYEAEEALTIAKDALAGRVKRP